MIDKFISIIGDFDQPTIINVNKIISVKEDCVQNIKFSIIKLEDGSCINTRTPFSEIKAELVPHTPI